MHLNHKFLKGVGIALLVPIILVLLLVVAVYLPPIQRWAVDKAADTMGQKMGLTVSVGSVRLTPFLDLRLQNVTALDEGQDTVLHTTDLLLDVAFAPLFEGRADIDGFRLRGARVNTKSFVPDAHISGRVGELSAAAHGVAWKEEKVHLDRALLADADLQVTLSDTAKKDTTSAPAKWVIDVVQARLQNTTLRLTLPGDSMHVAASLTDAQLQNGHFDLGKPHYAVHRLTVREGSVLMNMARAPLPQAALFDLRRLNVGIDSLSYDRAGRLQVRVSQLGFEERLRQFTVAHLGGRVYMDSARVSLPALSLRTPQSELNAQVEMEWRALKPEGKGTMRLQIDGGLSPADLLAAARGNMSAQEWQQLAAMVHDGLPQSPIGISVDVQGNVGNLAIHRAQLQLPNMLQIDVNGYLKNLLLDRRSGHLNYDLRTRHLQRLERLLPPSARTNIRLPEGLGWAGVLDFQRNDYRTQFRINLGRGRLTGRAAVGLDSERYEAMLQFTRLPLGHFLKGQPLSPFTGRLSASGRGFTIPAVRSNLVAKAHIQQLRYDKYPLDGLHLQARMRGTDAVVKFAAHNPLLKASGNVVAHLARGYNADVDIAVEEADLHRLAEIKDTLAVGLHFKGHLQSSADFKRFFTQGAFGSIRLLTPDQSYLFKDVDFAFRTAPDTTTAQLCTGDLNFRFSAAGDLPRLSRQSDRLVHLVTQQIRHRDIDQEALKRVLPDLSLRLDAGTDNLLAGFLRYRGYDLTSLTARLESNARTGLNGRLAMGKFKAGALLLDTIHVDLTHDEEGMKLLGVVHNNQRTNPNPFNAQVKSYLFERGLGVELVFADGKGDVGLNLGAKVELADGGYNIHLYPDTPIVAYRKFAVNNDNFIFLGDNRQIRADVRLLADDGTGLQIHSEGNDVAKNDISVSIKDLNLHELSNVLPYLPQLGGRLNGDFHLIDNHKTISAMGNVEARDFAYEGTPIGNLGGELVYMPKSDSEHYADAFIRFNGEEVAEVSGSYFTTGQGAFEGKARLKHFPLKLVSSFMADTGFALRGTAEGEFTLSGALDAPVMNGSLDLDKAHLYSNVYGIDFEMDERPLVFYNSRLVFEDYLLSSKGGNALTINGDVDMTRLEAIGLNFALDAKNFALINAKRSSGSLVFGKVYSNFTGTVKGTLDRIVVRGGLDILSNTDVTYILTNSPLTVKDELADLVTFTDFSDTLTTTPPEEKATSAIDILLGINIKPGARFLCNLSPNGDSYVDLSGNGRLTFRMNQQGEMRVTGRLTLDEGKMNYELPVIPLRTFTLVGGSYVEFKGNPMNPTLNITATDHVKTTITENERQRTVNFIAGVKITRSLEDMGLQFTIEAPDDLSIQNQLTSMSEEDRGKAAVALMATGMYINDDNLSTGGLKASNALNAFLQSEIQNIAGKALSTIDLSFGMENGTSASGASTTDYNFQFSKRFMNNRMRLIVGGKVSTGSDATTSTQSFIDNIALEYRLDAGSTRYVRVFYDRDAQDPLEGSLMKTGAGIVLRRKSDRIGDLFLLRRKKNNSPNAATSAQ